MKFDFKEGNFTVTEYGQSEKAELLLDKSLGLSQQADGTWAFVGDPYHCSTARLKGYYRRLEQLSTELGTAYAIEEAKTVLEAKNFFCSENEEGTIGSDGMIRMVFTNPY
jgi:hypothetical protein